MENLIYVKDIDKSVLTAGFTIKASLLNQFISCYGKLKIGEKRNISIFLNGKLCHDIKVINQPFSREKYPDHPEMYQVRYGRNSELAIHLRDIFKDLWEHIEIQEDIKNEMKIKGNKNFKKFIKIPYNMRCQLAFYVGENPDIWRAETIFPLEFNSLQKELSSHNISEEEFEDWQKYDDATIKIQQKNIKIRILDKSIGDNLKALYGFRCQICGEKIGDHYGEKHIIDAHHINPFIKSLDNNYNNIMIVCPNHHRIIHAYNPSFKAKLKELWYPNGLHEGLKLNLHL